MAVALFSGQDVLAHERVAPADASGFAIDNISHGEMAVLARYRDQVFGLGEKVRQPDQRFAAIQRFTGIQFSNCLWGWMPGSVEDEASPFNECAHAYLAGTKAMLFAMRDMPRVSAEAGQLISKIDADVVQTGAAFIGCQYSGEGFNTAEFIRPHWGAVHMHMPTFMRLLTLLFGPVLAAALLGRLFRALRGANAGKAATS